MRVRAFAWIAPLMLAAALLLAPAADALQITYSTPSGSTDADGRPLSILATFSTTAGVLTVDIQNQLGTPLKGYQTSASQGLSDIAFTLSNFQSTGALQSTSPPMIERTFAGTTAFTDTFGGVTSTGWALEQNVNGGYRLCILCTGTTKHTIIGGPGPTDGFHYDNADATLTDGSNSAFLAGPVKFTIKDIPNFNDQVYVDGVRFSFGTIEGTATVAGSCEGIAGVSCLPGRHVPEPASLLLLGAGLVGLAGLGWRTRRPAK